MHSSVGREVARLGGMESMVLYLDTLLVLERRWAYLWLGWGRLWSCVCPALSAPAPQSSKDRAYVVQPFSEVRTAWVWA